MSLPKDPVDMNDKLIKLLKTMKSRQLELDSIRKELCSIRQFQQDQRVQMESILQRLQRSYINILNLIIQKQLEQAQQLEYMHSLLLYIQQKYSMQDVSQQQQQQEIDILPSSDTVSQKVKDELDIVLGK